ncbi:hypothetical protein HanOQP8_Chr10g0348591 [Helianthus annuus]|nr:hypothetical protein HanLR1_Chr10g0344501 [Helianthus annuus]KAJ0698795.1 hypothetical protein HanOQP8_Chr10g0348591 [Helianthus annuus]
MTKTESAEHFLVDTLLSTLVSKDDVASKARSFLEANSGVEVCKKMLEMRESLKPSTQKVLALASEVKILEKEKDHLRHNLTTAEEEVRVCIIYRWQFRPIYRLNGLCTMSKFVQNLFLIHATS